MQTVQMKRDINFKDINDNYIIIRDNYTPQLKGCRTITNGLGYNYHEGDKVYPSPNKKVDKVVLFLNPIELLFFDNSNSVQLNKALIGMYKDKGEVYMIIDTLQKAYNHNTRISFININKRIRLQPNTKSKAYKDKRLDYGKAFVESGLINFIENYSYTF